MSDCHLPELTEHECWLTGLSTAHLVCVDMHVASVNKAQRIHHQVLPDFLAMQSAAANEGINLQIASGFRDYHRQASIWQRKVAQLGTQALSTQTSEQLHAILRWSAMPGASRHHWGTDMDVYDPDALGTESLQLEPWEYAEHGPLGKLSAWLQRHAAEFNFYLPYAADKGGVAIEPWHLSYAPLARLCTEQMSSELLRRVWQLHPPAAASWLHEHCESLVQRYVLNVTCSGPDR